MASEGNRRRREMLERRGKLFAKTKLKQFKNHLDEKGLSSPLHQIVFYVPASATKTPQNNKV